MSALHTPGPWQFGHLGTEELWVGPGHDQTPVAHVSHDGEYARDNSRANARLISTAPELLAAVIAALDAANELELSGAFFPREQLEMAIAKAGDLA